MEAATFILHTFSAWLRVGSIQVRQHGVSNTLANKPDLCSDHVIRATLVLINHATKAREHGFSTETCYRTGSRVGSRVRNAETHRVGSRVGNAETQRASSWVGSRVHDAETHRVGSRDRNAETHRLGSRVGNAETHCKQINPQTCQPSRSPVPCLATPDTIHDDRMKR